MKAAEHAYLVRTAAAGAGYVAVTYASRYAAREYDLEGIALSFAAALPILPALAWTMIYVHRFQAMDELQKRIQVDAFAAAGLFVGLVSFSLGLIEDVAAPRISVIWVFPATVFIWGALGCLMRWRYTR